MKVAVVKYNAGNIFSVLHALRRLGAEPVLSDDADVLRSADKVIFPGQGEASGAMQYLRARGLDRIIVSLSQPVLGICIGQQLLCKHSEEGDTGCLGIFDADVRRFQPLCHDDKIPHMGWNTIQAPAAAAEQGEGAGKVSPHLQEGAWWGTGTPFVYFVHSYYVPPCPHTSAITDYILPFSSVMHRDNFYATQFHPEKSGAAGQQILRNFLNL